MIKIISFTIVLLLIKINTYNEYKPVIGIYANPEPENDNDNYNMTYVPLSYIRWLESFGADVMIIQQWYNKSEIDEILSKINGVLFTGGGRDFNLSSNWEKNAIYIIEKAKNDKIPVWGTCMGFQLINVLLSRNYSILVNNFNDSSIVHGIIFNDKTKSSKMYSLFDESNFHILEEKTTLYFHSWGFKPEIYKTTNLTSIFNVNSIALDSNNIEFVNSIEGINDNIKIYATQYHPEKIPFIRNNNYKLPHERKILKVSVLLGAFFVNEARNNKNKFKMDDRKNYYFIDNYGNTTNYCKFDIDSEILYFAKNTTKKDPSKDKTKTYLLYYIGGGILAVIITIIIIYLIFGKTKKKLQNDQIGLLREL